MPPSTKSRKGYDPYKCNYCKHSIDFHDAKGCRFGVLDGKSCDCASFGSGRKKVRKAA